MLMCWLCVLGGGGGGGGRKGGGGVEALVISSLTLLLDVFRVTMWQA